ncbi:UNVERIFIED_CONTAM: hypothetical protein Sradi_5062100 [Sesamum radiatum]|uniref:Secreted protein n=1 Tax=Sesamum radiatum TaxID=300843 RepID=A0AAW2M1H9_SESRA
MPCPQRWVKAMLLPPIWATRAIAQRLRARVALCYRPRAKGVAYPKIVRRATPPPFRRRSEGQLLLPPIWATPGRSPRG